MRKKKTLARLPFEFGTVEIWGHGPHVVRQRIVDGWDYSFTRWILQRAVQRAGNLGFRSLDGLTDEAALKHRWHRFEINRPRLVRRFLTEIAPLLRRGLVEICLDGVAIALCTDKRHTQIRRQTSTDLNATRATQNRLKRLRVART